MKRIVFKIFIFFLFIYAISGFFLIPYLINNKLPALFSKDINATLIIESSHFNPFALTLNLKDVVLKSDKGQELVSFDALDVDVDALELLVGDIHIKEITLTQPQINLVFSKEKKLNILEIIPPNNDQNTTVSKGKLPKILFDRIAIVDGAINYEDDSKVKVYKAGVSGLNFKLFDLDTSDDNSTDTRQASSIVRANLSDGASLRIVNKLESLTPVVVDGDIDLQRLQLKTIWSYIQEPFHINLAKGYADAKLTYHVDLDKLKSTQISKGSLKLADMLITPKKKSTDLLSIKEIFLDDLTALPLQTKITIGSIDVDKLKANIKRVGASEVDWQEYLKVDAAKTEPSSKKGDSQPLSLSLHNFTLRNSTIHLQDMTLTKKSVIALNNISLHVSNINTKKDTKIGYKLALQTDKAGKISADGTVRLDPLTQEGGIKITKLPLTYINPYLDLFAYVKLQNTTVSYEAKESYSTQNNEMALSSKGSLGIDNLFLSSTLNGDKLLAIKALRVDPYTFELNPLRLYIDKVLVDGLYINAIITKDKSMNFAKLLKPDNSKKEPQTKSASTPKSDPFAFKIMQVNLKNSSADFSDLSIPLEFKTHIHDLNGKITPISTRADEVSFVDLDGVVNQYGSAKIKGSINTNNPKEYTDMNLIFRNLDMNAISPYSAKFAGYQIESGKLYLNLGYKIDKAKLSATNNVTIKQMKLGQTVNDPNITVLPLKLAVALLEDSDGVIDIDLPIQGNMDSPDFRYGSIVWKAITGLITKAVTAPFKMLGSLLGLGSDKSLDTIDFFGGKTVLLPPEIEKLDNLAKALLKRPKLQLIVTPSYELSRDTKGLQKTKLFDYIAKKSSDINNKEDKNSINIEMLESVYAQFVSSSKLDDLQKSLKKEFRDKQDFNQHYLEKLIDLDSAFMSVSQEDLEALAYKRGDVIVQYLTKTKKLDSARVVVAKVQKAQKDPKWAKIKLELNVK